MEQPFFSIIIPTYNRASMLVRAIESVLAQRFSDWELIIIDDGSIDETKEEVIKFTDHRIKYHYQENQERSVARNYGIKLSIGQYVCFLDSDDDYLNNHLDVLHQFIVKKEFPEAFMFTDVIRDEEAEPFKVPSPQVEVVTDPSFVLTTPESIIPCRVCIHKSLLDQEQFDERIRIGEDSDLWVRLLDNFPLYHVAEYTVTYRVQHDRTTSLRHNPFKGRLDGLRLLFRKPAEKKISTVVKRKNISECYFGIAGFHEFEKQYLKMSMALIMSFLY